jgi:hypothetical protein
MVRSGVESCRMGCWGRGSDGVMSSQVECGRSGAGRAGRIGPFELVWGRRGAMRGGSAGSGTGRVSEEWGW